ncbi:hypothetical protein C2W62_32160 [Candidatus Entotheonella serta]|nr:hypothetical protein C2W62_32160 [Candidatus Entotheonella serta]
MSRKSHLKRKRKKVLQSKKRHAASQNPDNPEYMAPTHPTEKRLLDIDEIMYIIDHGALETITTLHEYELRTVVLCADFKELEWFEKAFYDMKAKAAKGGDIEGPLAVSSYYIFHLIRIAADEKDSRIKPLSFILSDDEIQDGINILMEKGMMVPN